MLASVAALALLATGAASQAIMGFNYGSSFTGGAAKAQADFEAEFNQARGLVGAPGFTSARLYTMIQAGSTNTPISAIPAAIATQTRLLLGLWGSAGEAGIQQEIAALSAAISQYGTAFIDLIDGISVGSEDLYRISPTGIINMSGVGAGPDEIASYIGQVRTAIANTPASGALVGHVDTWTAWVNGSNQAVIDASDFIGTDQYPYFQNTIANGIDIGQQVFNDAVDATRAVAGGKPVWITETGWPVSGPQENQAVASIPNAQTYWQQVSCQYQGSVNLWWYTLQDSLPDTPSPSFGLVGAAGGTTPLFDLSCPNGKGNAASSSIAPSASAQASSVAAEVSAAATGGSAAPSADSGSPGASALTSSSAAAAPSEAVSSVHLASTGSSAAAGVDQTSAASAGSSAAASADKTSATSAADKTAGPVVSMTVYETTSLCPVTLTGTSGAVSTVLSTSIFTVTSCPGGCAHEATAAPSAGATGSAPGTPQSAASQAAAPAPSATSTASASGACPPSLSGVYEYPHLVVPVDKSKPDIAFGTSYNGSVSSTVSSIFNFDIPASHADKTCTLVFLFPEKKDLQTSSYELSGTGGIDVKGLKAPADESTTYSNAPAVSADVGSVPSLAPGNSYTISSGSCAAGQRIGYEVSATGDLSLNYFQDYNPSPLGLYITVC